MVEHDHDLDGAEFRAALINTVQAYMTDHEIVAAAMTLASTLDLDHVHLLIDRLQEVARTKTDQVSKLTAGELIRRDEDLIRYAAEIRESLQ